VDFLEIKVLLAENHRETVAIGFSSSGTTPKGWNKHG
jgi:hypothetical protein